MPVFGASTSCLLEVRSRFRAQFWHVAAAGFAERCREGPLNAAEYEALADICEFAGRTFRRLSERSNRQVAQASADTSVDAFASYPLALTVREAAELLRVGRSGIYQLLNSGELPSICVGRSRRIARASLTDWINNRSH